MKLKRKLRRAAGENKKSGRFKWLSLIELAVAFVVVFGIYETACYLEFKPILPIYLVITCGLLAAFIILNRGLSTKPVTEDELPDDWDRETKDRYMTAENGRKSTAKKLLILIIPFVLTYLIDFVYLFYIFKG